MCIYIYIYIYTYIYAHSFPPTVTEFAAAGAGACAASWGSREGVETIIGCRIKQNNIYIYIYIYISNKPATEQTSEQRNNETNETTSKLTNKPSDQATKQPSNQATKQPSNQASKRTSPPLALPTCAAPAPRPALAGRAQDLYIAQVVSLSRDPWEATPTHSISENKQEHQ